MNNISDLDNGSQRQLWHIITTWSGLNLIITLSLSRAIKAVSNFRGRWFCFARHKFNLAYQSLLFAEST